MKVTNSNVISHDNNLYKGGGSISSRTRRLAKKSGIDNSSNINASNVSIGDSDYIYNYGATMSPVVITPNGYSESDKYRAAVNSINDWFYRHPEKMADKKMQKKYRQYWDQTTWDNYYNKVALNQPKTKSGNWDLKNDYIKVLPDDYKKKMFASNVAARGNEEWSWANNLAMNLALSPLMFAGAGSNTVSKIPQQFVSMADRVAAGKLGDVVRFVLEPFKPIAKALGANAATASKFSNAAYGVIGAGAAKHLADNWENMSLGQKAIDVPLTALGLIPTVSTGVNFLKRYKNAVDATANIAKNKAASTSPFISLGKGKNVLSLPQSKSNVLSLPQSTGIYPQIKPLMRGAEIEKQLSKAGTINRNQLELYIAKQGKYYQEVMNDVLNNEFNGVTRIDYNAFRDVVQRRLPEYSRVPQTKFRDYGMERLGFKFNDTVYDSILGEELWITYATKDDIKKLIKIKKDIDSGKITNREYMIAFRKIKKDIVERILPSRNTFTFETPGIAGDPKHYDGTPIGHSRTYTIKEEPDVLHVMESQSDWAQNFMPTFRMVGEDGKNIPVQSKLTQKHMADTYMERQIQENLKYAAEQGQNKMRYPTRETAAKIEGYEKRPLIDEIKKLRIEQDEFIEKYGYESKEIEKKIQDLINTVDYAPEHKTILKKYDAFPKQFQKLFGKNAEIRTVIDDKSNSWYEVDVPKSYLDKTAEIQFASGGYLKDKYYNTVLKTK